MRYEGVVYRPPSEARSLIIQVAIGCSHNKCTFCSMYRGRRFRVRSMDDIIEDLETARQSYGHVKRIFLADGNALVLKTDDLVMILDKIKELFPECERVGIYSAPGDILRKSLDELRLLKNHGLGIAYLGVESGSDKILSDINKGVTSSDMIEAGKRMKESGITLSVMIISGIGGREGIREHAIESSRVINAIKPDYLSLLTLLVNEGTELYDDVNNGRFELLKAKEVLEETRLFISELDIDDCTFRSNHASNYVALGGVLSRDKQRLLNEIDSALRENYDYKDEMLRRL